VSAYRGSDGRWRYRFSYRGKRYSGSTPKGHNTKKAAERIEREYLERLIARQYLGKMPTVREFAARFLEHQQARTKPLTYNQQKATIEQHVLPRLGSSRVDDIHREEIDSLVTQWSANSKPKTINTRLGTLRRMLSLAVEWGLIPRVPRIEMRKLAKDTPRFLSDAECTELVAAAEPQWATMIVVGLRTGLRIGELRGLQWGDVDLVRRAIQVRRTDPGRRTMDATSPKGNRERTVPLTNDAIAALESVLPAKPVASDWVWPALLRRQGETRRRARSEKGCWHAIDRAATKAGLLDVGWHTLRHTYASHLVMRGVPIRLIQKWLGHASIKETEKYSHLAPEFGAEAINMLDLPLTPESPCQTGAKALPDPSRERKKNAPLPVED
jgi:integrase